MLYVHILVKTQSIVQLCNLSYNMTNINLISALKYPSKINNNFENSYLKSFICLIIDITLFTIFEFRLKYFVI